MNLRELRQHTTPWIDWWVGGWQEAWARLPKPDSLQDRPEVFQTERGGFLTCIVKPGESAAWQNASRQDALRGLLIDDEKTLFRELTLPSLNERDIAAAVALEVRIASPYPADDTRYGYRAHRQPNGSLRLEIAITRQSQLEQVHIASPQAPLFARGSHGAISLQGDTQTSRRTGIRSPLTLNLLALLTLVLIAWIISPTLLLRTQAQAHELALAKLSREAAPLLQKREELGILQQHLENAHTFDSEHPDPQLLLEQLSSQIPDNTWINQLSLNKGLLTFDGTSENAIAVVSLLEKIPELKEVRLGSSVNRDPRSGKETFQVIARAQAKEINANGVKQ